MNQKEATEIVVNYLNPIFSERGYKYKKSKWNGFVKEYEEGFEYVNIHFYNYWPVQQPGYGVVKRFNIVEQLYNNVVDEFDLSKEGDRKTNGTFYFSYESLNNLSSIGYLKGGETELEMLADAEKIKDFMLDVGFPMLKKYDLKTIDAEINGDDFWDTDWQHKFQLGGGFQFKRTIIAYLCKNRNIEEIKEYHLKNWGKSLKEYPDCANLIDAYNYLTETMLK